MDLTLQTETFGNDKMSWLGSAHGTSSGDSVTLDRTLLRPEWIAQGFVPSGVVLGKAANGLHGPYDNAATDGRQTATGHLLFAVQVRAGNPGGSQIWHGQVIVPKLPANSGFDAGVREDLPQIDYQD